MNRMAWITLGMACLVASPSLASTCFVATGARFGPEQTPGDFCDSVPLAQPIGDDKDVPQDQYANQCDADFNQDCVVTMADFMLFIANLFSPGPSPFDLDLSNQVDGGDFIIFAEMFGKTLPQ